MEIFNNAKAEKMRFSLLIASLITVSSMMGCGFQAPPASDDVYLRCKGEVSIFRVGGMQIVEKQEIAAHIKEAKISFSGNGLLLGESIPICTPSNDQPNFDSESCEGSSRSDKKRKYGTYNKVTGALDLTNEKWENNVAFIEGHFKCTKTEPLMK